MVQPHAGSRLWYVLATLTVCVAALQACSKSSAVAPGLGDAAVLVVPENLAVVDSELGESGPTLSATLIIEASVAAEHLASEDW